MRPNSIRFVHNMLSLPHLHEGLWGREHHWSNERISVSPPSFTPFAPLTFSQAFQKRRKGRWTPSGKLEIVKDTFSIMTRREVLAFTSGIAFTTRYILGSGELSGNDNHVFLLLPLFVIESGKDLEPSESFALLSTIRLCDVPNAHSSKPTN